MRSIIIFSSPYSFAACVIALALKYPTEIFILADDNWAMAPIINSQSEFYLMLKMHENFQKILRQLIANNDTRKILSMTPPILMLSGTNRLPFLNIETKLSYSLTSEISKSDLNFSKGNFNFVEIETPTDFLLLLYKYNLIPCAFIKENNVLSFFKIFQHEQIITTEINQLAKEIQHNLNDGFLIIPRNFQKKPIFIDVNKVEQLLRAFPLEGQVFGICRIDAYKVII